MRCSIGGGCSVASEIDVSSFVGELENGEHGAESLRALLAACVEDFAFRVLRGNPKGRAVPKPSSYLLSVKVGACLSHTNPAVVDMPKAGELVVCLDAQDEAAFRDSAVVMPDLSTLPVTLTILLGPSCCGYVALVCWYHVIDPHSLMMECWGHCYLR
jgi:hypothetical protein